MERDGKPVELTMQQITELLNKQQQEIMMLRRHNQELIKQLQELKLENDSK
jgi:hypothetical protein